MAAIMTRPCAAPRPPGGLTRRATGGSSSEATLSNQAASAGGCGSAGSVACQRRLSWFAAECSCQSSSSASAQSSIRIAASASTSSPRAPSCSWVTPAS